MRRDKEEEKAILLKEVELLGKVSLAAKKHGIPQAFRNGNLKQDRYKVYCVGIKHFLGKKYATLQLS